MDVLIENVQITVSKWILRLIILEPITDQSLWEHSDQKMTFELKEQALNAFASQMYSDLIVSFTVICYPYSENKRRTRKRGRHDERTHH